MAGGCALQGVYVAGGVHGRGACTAGGHAWRGHTWQGGMHGGEACMAVGHTWQGGMCGRGCAVVRGLSSIPTGGNILSLDFFSHSETSNANIGIIDNVVCL